MTDLIDPVPNPDLDQQPINSAVGQRRASVGLALGSLDDNPDDAARAQQIGQAIGVPGVVVNGDLENYEKQHKAMLAGQILNNNPWLRDFVSTHPIAASMSNDDWGNLDNVSRAVNKIGPNSAMATGIKAYWDYNANFVKRFVEGSDLFTQPAQEFYQNNPKLVQDHPLVAALFGTALEGYHAAGADRLSGILPGLIHAGTHAAGDVFDKVTGSNQGTQYADQFEQWVSDPGVQMSLLGIPEAGPFLEAAAVRVGGALSRARPYIESRTEPPVGIHPVIDQAKHEEAKIDVDNLMNAVTEVQKSSTKERDSNLFANFIRQHTQAEIGISSEAVRKLYGDTVPMPDDGLLGFIPGIQDQLIGAEPVGGDVNVSLADWLAHVEPDVAKQLRDDTRVRRGGVTLNEAKELEPTEQPLRVSASVEDSADDLMDTIRQQGGLVVGDRVTLQKVSQGTGQYADVHDYDFIDREGNRVGDIQLTYDQAKKDLFVEYVRHDEGPQAMGTRMTRDLLRQLKQEFPEAQTISGIRVSGAREAATRTEAGTIDPMFMGERVRIPLKADFTGESARDFAEMVRNRQFDIGQDAKGNRWIRLGSSGEDAWFKPKKTWTDNEREVVKNVHAVLQKLVPRMVRGLPAEGLQMGGKTAHGMYVPFRDTIPYITWAVGSPDVAGTVRHEAIHHLRQYGFFTNDEWSVLKKASIEQGWMDKFNIRTRYAGHGAAEMLEESIAEGFKQWFQKKWDEKLGMFRLPDSPFERVMQKLGRLYVSIRRAIREAIGKNPDFNDLFDKVEAGEIGSRKGVKPLDPRVFRHPMAARPDQPELPGVTQMEDRAPFEEGALKGMTIRTQRKYMDLMRQRDLEDMEFARKQNEKDVTRRQTEEWKANERAIREQIRPGFEDRPDLAADKFLREGRLYGEKVRGKPRLNGSLLTPEQRAILPKDYVGEHGIHPDDAANLFGYHAGDELVNALASIHRDREATGLTPGRYVNHLVDSEVARRMQIEHGDLAQNILSETQDHVISQTQFDMLHEETLHNAMLAGIDTSKSSPEIPFTKQHMEQFARQKFNQLRLGQVSTEAHLRDGLRANELAERALLDNDPTEAFKQKQRQAFSFLYAREAKRLEKVEKRFDRLTKKYSAREPSGVPAEYTNYIHQIMGRFKLSVSRTARDLATELEAQGYGNLREFVDHKNGDFGNMQLDDRLYDPSFGKPVDQLTTEEFQAVTDALVTLDKAGRSESKVLREGAAEDRATLVNGMQDQLETFPLKEYSLKGGMFRGLTDLAKKYMTVGIINAETWLNRWDRDDLHGLFNQWLVRPLSAAANREATLGREFGKLYREVGEVKDRDRLVRSPLNDPMSITRSDPDGRPYVGFSRKNIAAMISNAGNEYNWDILTRGHNADPNLIWNWLIHNSTREDWVRAEKLGKVFEQAFEMAQTVYRNLYGVAPPKIELRPIHIDFPNGEKFDSNGWYHPIIRDEKATNLVRSARGEDLLERDKGLFPSIANGYTKRRTGKVDVLSLNHDMVVPRLNQIIHDVAFRSEVIEAAKVVKDPKLRKSIRQYYGEQYVPMLDNWLSDIAGASNIPYGLMSDITRTSNYARTNVIGSLIGFNPGTVLKHGPTALVNSMYEVGLRAFSKDFAQTTLPFLRESMQHLFTSDQDFADRQLKFIFDNSEEIRRRDRNWQETIGGAHKIIEGKPTLRDRMIMWGSKPVAMSDMLSALPTWLAAYKEEFAREGNHGDAVFAGERAVRRAHGSTAVTNLPELVRRSGPFGSWLTTLYGFFSTQMQRRAEIAFKANDTWKLAREGELKSAGSNLVKLTPLIFSTLIWPTVVEEYVNSIGTDDRRGPLTRLASAAFGGLASSFLYFRDLAHGAVTGQEPSVGMASTPAHDIANVFKETAHPTRALDRNHAAKTVSDFITVFGEATGLAPKQLAKVVRFGMGVGQGTERPKGPADVGVGLMRGTTKRRIER